MANKLYEYMSPEQSRVQILESKDGKDLFMQGLFIQGDVKNQNGRVYPKDEIAKACDSVKERLGKGETVMGELDHPESTVINLKNVCHNIKDIWWDGDNIIGKIEILPTPSGNILQALMNSGITVGVSSRGMGSVRQMGETLEVQEDFELLCWDFVSTPSNPGSWMTPLHEGLTKTVSQYSKANEIIREILCAHGNCPIF